MLGRLLPLSFLVSAGLSGQSVLRPAANPSCTRCEIVIRPVVTLGDQEGEGALHGEPYALARDSRGRFVVAVPSGREERLYVYGSDGRLLHRVGPPGEGPGQVQSVRVIAITSGDTLHVYDDVLGRHSVFGPDYRFVRSHQSPRELSSVAFLANGTAIVAANVNDPQRVGLLYHRFHANGNYLSSFGDSTQILSSSRPSVAVRRMAPSHSGGFWTAAWLYRFRLELWSSTGSLLRALEPEPGWFQPYDQILGPTPERPPQAMLFGLWEDPFGRVWISGVTPGRNYRRGLGQKKLIEGTEVFPVEDPERMWDGIIQVFDPAQGVLLASRAIDAPFHFALPGDLFAGVRTDRDGLLSLEVVSVVLRTPRQ